MLCYSEQNGHFVFLLNYKHAGPKSMILHLKNSDKNCKNFRADCYLSCVYVPNNYNSYSHGQAAENLIGQGNESKAPMAIHENDAGNKHNSLDFTCMKNI